MQGLTMDYQLNVGTILRRGEELFGHKIDHEPAARQELAHIHVRRFRPSRQAALAGAAG